MHAESTLPGILDPFAVISDCKINPAFRMEYLYPLLLYEGKGKELPNVL